MRLLRDLFRRKRPVLPASVSWLDGPAPAEVLFLADGTNPIHRLLDDWRLPRHETRADVAARVGVSPDPIYHWDALVFREALLLPGAMQPWTASAHDRIPPQFPISRFSGLVWFEDDAHTNVRRAADFLTASLGPAPIGKHWNTLVATWRSGLAEISLIAWPSQWQSNRLPNPAEDRDRRLCSACHVRVVTGFCLSLSAQEKTWVRGFRPLRFDGEVGAARMARAGTMAPSETQLEYARNPEHLVDDRQAELGLSADGQALIVVSDQLFVIACDAVLRLEVARLTPAKGGGGSTLYARCRSEAPDMEGQSVFLAQSSNPDGLNAFARDLGVRLGCPVEVGPYYSDC
ncbi:hypothetical protein [Mesorhizobium sp. CAU 1732]|uniref:hypothetical protein n=1 Tax=Mesorhizobium sp. CAU 1732 TaxID=3140358 RepID=UPI0032607711